MTSISRLFLLCSLLASALLNAQPAPVEWQRHWPLTSTLDETHNKQPFRLIAGHLLMESQTDPDPVFIQDGDRRALQLTAKNHLVVGDDVLQHLAPGLRLACRLRLDTLNPPAGWSTIVSKGGINEVGSFTLRVDRYPEKPKFSFFVNLTGRPEPRVSSVMEIQTGVWYDIEAGWDGKDVWLSVNGEITRTPRPGLPVSNFAPFLVGPFNGCVSDVRLTGNLDSSYIVGNWPFDNSLQDISGHNHHFAPATPDGFAATTDGRKALVRSLLSTPSTPELQLAPGLHFQCTVTFNQIPTGETIIFWKRNEYLLRYDTTAKGGAFNAFFHLNGKWEPRLHCPLQAKPGERYFISAGWSGTNATIQVNGKIVNVARSGLIPHPTDNPLEISMFNGTLDDLIIANPRTPFTSLEDLRTAQLFPLVGDELTLQGKLVNHGAAIPDCSVVLTAPKELGVANPVINLDTLEGFQSALLKWQMTPTGTVATNVQIDIRSGSKTIQSHRTRLSVQEREDPPHAARDWQPPVSQTRAFYIDSVNGHDDRDGATPETAWKSFKNINGKVLGPGERLLLKRGCVFPDELILSAQGTAQNWAEIAAYGDGHRPTIRRQRMLNQRCAYITDPDYLAVRDLIVCNAGKGLDISCLRSGHGNILIENCLAHHIEGIYRFNAHGIPEWRDQVGAGGTVAGGLAVGGSRPDNVTFRDCEMYQCSVAFRMNADHGVFSRLFCHDNYAHNTSPHPVISSALRSRLVDSIFDASGWKASAGTMGIMLGPNDHFIIRNCHWLNQPDSGSHDEGGIDFEAGGYSNIIEHCTFRNNAGAAIEVLGLRSPQCRNITIRNNRFFRNNTALKLGPGEVFVWGGSRDPAIVCSNGVIRDNGYTLFPGVKFYTNLAERTIPDWLLENNTAYDTPEQLDQAMPFNNPPQPAAGPEIWTDTPTVTLNGAVSDDHRTPTPLVTSWELLEGPANVAFQKADAPVTTATFPAPGDYRLNLKADDGELWRTSRTAVHLLPRGTRVAKAWTFSHNLDKEGWSDADLGTAHEVFPGTTPHTGTFSDPVNLVCGDFYVLAVKNAPNAHILSPEKLNLSTVECPILTLRLQNHTNSKRMKVSFLTDANDDWNSAASLTFPVTPNDDNDSLYTVKLTDCPAYKGTLRQFRIDFSADDTPVTGTCRFDYIWLGKH